MIQCSYDIYENGYQNGIQFGYIPDCAKEELQIWALGYKDAKNRNKKSIIDFNQYFCQKELDNLSKI